jgi:hypothetical protein
VEMRPGEVDLIPFEIDGLCDPQPMPRQLWKVSSAAS